MDSAQDSYKKWGIVLIVFLLILIPAEIALTKPNAIENLKLKFQTSFSEKPKVRVIPKEEVAASFDHPSLYYVDLEYDPTLNKVAKLGSGKASGDLEILLPEPSSSSATFSYKVDAVSAEGKLISSGWVSLYKTVITTESGKYQFRISAQYEKGAKINIYLQNNQRLWEEQIK